MSIRIKEKVRMSSPESNLRNEDKTKFTFFENLNINHLNSFYSKEESAFKKKVDKLNLKFYLETDKFLGIKTDLEKSQDHLFLILFKQVSLYVEEIERLNYKIKEKDDNDKFNKTRIEVNT